MLTQSGLAQDSRLDLKCFRKGGVGAVSDGIFIILDGDRNELQVAEKRWQGRPSDKCEVVIVDSKGVLPDGADLASDSVRVIIFSPKRVRFVDYKLGQTGYYERFPRSKVTQ